MASAASITPVEFKDALGRYPALIKKLSDAEKPAPLTLQQLDQYRYIDAPAAFSQQTSRTMKLQDVQKLVEWKLRHGKWRPSLTKLVASNNDEKVAAATHEAFAHYSKNPSDLTETLKLLSTPLKGVGPATASLLLSVHDPKNVIFFSDEAYRWLVANGEKVNLTYNSKEYESLNAKAQEFIKKLKVAPIDVEKVAFVLIQESEPVREAAPKKIPSGRPRGRPPKPESEKKIKKPAVPGRGRGRPRKTESGTTVAKPAATPGQAKKRGRPPKETAEAAENAPTDANAEDNKVEVNTPNGGKRKAPDSASASAKRSSKKTKT